MKIAAWQVNKRLVIFLILTLIWYVLIWSAYDYEHLLPQVQMGKYNSWPLYFFLLDAFGLGLVAFYASILWRRRNTKGFILYILLGLFMLYPLLMVYATYDDLYSSVCLKLDPVMHDCVKYRPPPDLGNISLKWED